MTMIGSGGNSNLARQARHKMVSLYVDVRFANRGLSYERFSCEAKLAYSN